GEAGPPGNWSDPEVVELLQLWADESVQIELESCLRNQHVFNRIAEVLREKGIHRTGDQCREKIKKMKLEYRRIKDNSKAPRGGRTWKFYEVMDRVLTSRPALAYGSLSFTLVFFFSAGEGNKACLCHFACCTYSSLLLCIHRFQ
uniref:Myb/SANT-like DNA-binding domain-containing protein n=1 Tax=Malurus cyaneus samueli TaxID=2593467 RepID=A0A8C5UM47_9PASS